MSKAGFTTPGLQCEQCGIPFALSLAGILGRRQVERLPDPFEIVCPLCGHEAIYPKSAIQTLVARPRP